ncbi:MAG: hypothetical protein LQ350_006430 [Teloschistes chrysophthalmus]|nr:MAG: hypothetical protein LQ350_006430 [Niorma chrysophthalma]
MYNDRPHPLLAQIPLTVSPFISLPSAPTLPYTYKPLPSTLPPSSTMSPTTNAESSKFILSPSGHAAASPEEIIASCQTLQAHIQKMQEDAEAFLRKWEEGLKEEELAEKRRVAPGWLDRQEKILQPTNKSGNPEYNGGEAMQMQGLSANIMDQQTGGEVGSLQPSIQDQEGDVLDRAFGGMALKTSS